ncbi:MAG: CHASE domain-containing protein, partial [Thiohalomonadales bacterium]
MDKTALKTWIIIVAISGSSLSLVFFKYLQHVRTQHVNAIISQTTAHYQKLFSAKISTLLNELKFAQNFLQSSKDIDLISFQQLSRPKKQAASALIALEWIPRISEENLEQHQSNTRLHGNSDYLVKELTLRGKFTPVRKRTHYYPILYAEPNAFNKNILGYDIGSDPEQLSTLKRAVTTTTGTSTATLTLVQNNVTQDGFIILMPVYKANLSTDSTELRARELRGFIAGAFSISELIKDSLGFIKNPSTIIRFIDITEP